MGLKKWFDRKNASEKSLLCSVFILVVVVVVLFICFLTSRDNICTRPECLRAAVHILDTVNPNADPCDDFYAFACGNFMKTAVLQGQPTTLHSLVELTENQVKQIVAEKHNETELPKSLIFQRMLYRACNDERSIEEDENRTFLKLLDELIGGWPLIKMNGWIEDHFTWKNTMLKARKLGLFFNLFFRVETYENNTSEKSLLWVRPLSAGELDDFNFNDSNTEIIHDIVKSLGANSVDVISDLRITSFFVDRLKQISKKSNNGTLPSNSNSEKNITVREINHKFIKLDWRDFLSKITGFSIKETDQIVFDINHYLTDLYYLLLQTPKRIQANYVAWVTLVTNVNYLSKNIRDKYDQILRDAKTVTRNEQCYKLSKGLVKFTAEAEYIRRYTTPEKKRQIKSMTDYIKSEMESLIEASPWMDEQSKKNGMRRLKNITTSIGWLDVVFNVTKVEQMIGYDKVQRIPNDKQIAIDIARRALKIKYDIIFKQINLKLDFLEKVGKPRLEVNSYYIRIYNILMLPTPILQGQIFDPNRPNYMNFGALGTIIGHELSHGFTLYQNLDVVTAEDDPEDLWTNRTAVKRTEIAQCVDDKYNDFQTAHGRNTTNHTSGEENIADFNGVNIAYAAYQNWVKYNGREANLPGIGLTQNQIFWIMASTYMCFEPKLFNKDKIVEMDRYHGHPEFRIVGRIQNSPHFANDFSCPEGSKMNPPKKCQIFV